MLIHVLFFFIFFKHIETITIENFANIILCMASNSPEKLIIIDIEGQGNANLIGQLKLSLTNIIFHQMIEKSYCNNHFMKEINENIKQA